MVDYIQGPVKFLEKQRIVVMVGSLGYGVQVSDEHQFSCGQQVELYTSLHWNQDKGPSLFGFKTMLEKQVFQLIIGCAGIGPKIALAALAHMSAGSFVSAVTEGDVKALSGVSGIGTKKAENMIVQLRSKVEKLVDSGVELGSGGEQAKHFSEVSQVLVTLNYSKPEINSALEYVKKHDDVMQLSFDGILRKALGYLSKQI